MLRKRPHFKGRIIGGPGSRIKAGSTFMRVSQLTMWQDVTSYLALFLLFYSSLLGLITSSGT